MKYNWFWASANELDVRPFYQLKLLGSNGCQNLKTCIWFFFIQLDSLKPKESLVMRQRYGLDGKGDRTLGEIAGNLNISREMVRKHEVKALLKLKHPARVDYLRQHLV